MRWALVCVAAAACGGDRFGAYLDVHAPAGFDRLEFFFGGSFPSRRCMNMASMFAIPPSSTAAWTRPLAQDPRLDATFRRELAGNDVQMVRAGTTSFTYYVPPGDGDPDVAYPSGFGKVLVIVASSGNALVGIARLDGFATNDGEVDRYRIDLQPPPSHGLEMWGIGDGPSCLRWTAADGTSTFITREWDRDCDGLASKLCDYDGSGTVWEDCDPLTYCDPANEQTCITNNGCYVPLMPTVSDPMLCTLGVCANPKGGMPACTAPLQPMFCLGGDMCSQKTHCDRRLSDCAMIDSTPDLACKVPVDDKGNVCGMTTAIPLFPLAAVGCAGSAFAEQRQFTDPAPAIRFSIAVDAVMTDCSLILTAAPTGFLPTTRVLASFGNLSGTTEASTLLIELAPDKVGCASPEPQCTPMTATAHACPM